MKTLQIRKTGPALVALYDANGKIFGVADPAKIQPVAAPSTPAADVAKLRKSALQAPVVAEREQSAEALNRAAVAMLRQIHRRPTRVGGRTA